MDIVINNENLMKGVLNKLEKGGTPVVLFGAGLCGKNYLDVLNKNGIKVAAFCDDSKDKQEKGFMGYRVIPVEDLLSDDYSAFPIIISSFGPSKLKGRLASVSPELAERVIWADFYLWEDGLDYYRYYSENMDLINKAYGLLGDEKSKRVFLNLLNYKISRDKKLIDEIKDPAEKQYFDRELISFGTKEVFLDLGAYNGDTVLRFVKETGSRYEKIYAVEPDGENYRALLKNVESFPDVECLKCGVGERDGVVRFSADGTWTSAADPDGNTEITVKSVESIVGENRLTYVKADIEGSEQEMLKGAERVIQREHPRMAVAVYHKKEDIISLIVFIHSLWQGYRFYLRHYTEMPIDTVLYAVR